MKSNFVYIELVVAILFAIAAYVCGVIGEKAKKNRWVTSFCAVGIAYLALMEASYGHFLDKPEVQGPIAAYTMMGFCITFVGGVITAGLSWILGRLSYYIGATAWGAILLAYRASQKAKVPDSE